MVPRSSTDATHDLSNRSYELKLRPAEETASVFPEFPSHIALHSLPSFDHSENAISEKSQQHQTRPHSRSPLGHRQNLHKPQVPQDPNFRNVPRRGSRKHPELRVVKLARVACQQSKLHNVYLSNLGPGSNSVFRNRSVRVDWGDRELVVSEM